MLLMLRGGVMARALPEMLLTMQAAKISCTLRDTRGLEAAAACGQLQNISLPRLEQEEPANAAAEKQAPELVLA